MKFKLGHYYKDSHGSLVVLTEEKIDYFEAYLQRLDDPENVYPSFVTKNSECLWEETTSYHWNEMLERKLDNPPLPGEKEK